MNPARENILNRVRAALRSPAHRPPLPTDAPFFPLVTDLEKRFSEELAALNGELLQTRADLDQFLAQFKNIATDESELVARVVGKSNAGVREADLGVTACDCLVAQTGSVIVSTRSAGGRAWSVLPPAHLVVARRDQLLPDLAAALALLRQRYDRHWPSAISVISGPSRTADIEKILVLGAHGPKRLAVYLAE